MIDAFLRTIQHITLNESNMLKYTQHAVNTIPKAKSHSHANQHLSARNPSANKYPTQDDLFWCFYLIHLGFLKLSITHIVSSALFIFCSLSLPVYSDHSSLSAPIIRCVFSISLWSFYLALFSYQ